MCMILDAHKWADFFNETKDMKPVHKWINDNNGKIVYSNHQKIENEIKKSKGKKALRYLQEGKSAGRKVKFISKEDVMKAEKEIKKHSHLLKSNDIHILALAKASKTTLLCSGDLNLQKDFKNKKLIAGKVYQYKKQHSKLLTPDACP